MRIGIVELSLSAIKTSKYYNDQEISLGKVFSSNGYDVDVYKFISTNSTKKDIKYNELLNVHYIPSKHIGNNTIVNTEVLNENLDVLICFSDIQLSVSKVFNWAKRKNVVFIPYVGVLKSSSNNPIKKILMNISKIIALSIYKKCLTIAKTQYIENELKEYGINNSKVIPVGLDFELLNQKYKQVDKKELRRKYDCNNDDYIILIVSKLESYRNPLDVLPVFDEVYKNYRNAKLLIVGSGTLKSELLNEIETREYKDSFKLIENIENQNIWEVYCLSDKYVSFNRNEIFGMSILEAMYYELPVHAINAPGPNDIIGDCGYLYCSSEEMAKDICANIDNSIGKKAHDRVISNNDWHQFVEFIKDLK